MQKLLILTDWQEHYKDKAFDSDRNRLEGPFVKEYLKDYLSDGWRVSYVGPVSCMPIGEGGSSVMVKTLIQIVVVLDKIEPCA